jgi:hypothetical protein
VVLVLVIVIRPIPDRKTDFDVSRLETVLDRLMPSAPKWLSREVDFGVSCIKTRITVAILIASSVWPLSNASQDRQRKVSWRVRWALKAIHMAVASSIAPTLNGPCSGLRLVQLAGNAEGTA